MTPATATISTIQTQQFTATVVNSNNSAVAWSVDGIQGGNASVGIISAAGLYTPPPSAATHVISAASEADLTKTGSATITVQLPLIAVTVTPATATISTIQTQQFTATVVNSNNSAVAWSVDGIQGGNASVGIISAAGLYTPPPSAATHVISAASEADPSKSSGANVAVTILNGVLTYHNDNTRSGQYLQESVLTPSNVNSTTFGKLFSFSVDGFVYAQPLYVSNVPIAGQLHNVVFIATEHNSVYAFDADNRTSAPLWHISFINPANGITTVPSSDTNCADLTPEIGITSTPVIDPVTGILYVVAMTKENGTYAYRIHALDITTGNEKFGTGLKIQASVPGTAAPNDGNGHLVFTSLLENQRAALLLNNNALYVSFGSWCDYGNYHGWLLAYNPQTLNLLSAFSPSPNGIGGGIWQSGGGTAADSNGNVYAITSNGTFDASTGGSDYSDTFLKFAAPTLTAADYFTPFNQATLQAVNADLGSGAPLLLPDQSTGPAHLLVSAGKQGTIYLVNRDNMGKYQTANDSQIVQSIPGPYSLFGTPAYFNNTVYMAAVGDSLKAYTLSNGQLTLSKQSTSVFTWPGATVGISANGLNNGIAWALETNGSGAPAILRAYSTTDVSVELYNSNQNPGRDSPGPAIKFSVPTIANGKVYVGAVGQLSVFGLLP
ncbi:MAG: pyrrolo-quinoline quinone [Sulfuricaulis sp.]